MDHPTREKPFRTTFFFRGKYMGEGYRGRIARNNSIPHNNAFFCPQCSEIWARSVTEGSNVWQASHMPCPDHGKWSIIEVPGSVWSPWDDDFNDALPMSMLLREWNLALERYRRFGAEALA